MTHKKRPSTEKMYDYKKEKQKRIFYVSKTGTKTEK